MGITKGLVICAVGDIFMELQKVYDACFLGGLVAFLIGHVFYANTFRATGRNTSFIMSCFIGSIIACCTSQQPRPRLNMTSLAQSP